jgi:hypothetical protein
MMPQGGCEHGWRSWRADGGMRAPNLRAWSTSSMRFTTRSMLASPSSSMRLAGVTAGRRCSLRCSTYWTSFPVARACDSRSLRSTRRSRSSGSSASSFAGAQAFGPSRPRTREEPWHGGLAPLRSGSAMESHPREPGRAPDRETRRGRGSAWRRSRPVALGTVDLAAGGQCPVAGHSGQAGAQAAVIASPDLARRLDDAAACAHIDRSTLSSINRRSAR